MRASTCVIVVAIGFGLVAAAQAQSSNTCSDLDRLRVKANEAWKQVQRAPRADRCAAYLQFSWADDALLQYVKQNQDACNMSADMIDAMEAQHQSTNQERRSICQNRPRPRPAFPPEKFQH
jgi:hypothetical protein